MRKWGPTLGIGAINLAHLESIKARVGESVVDVGCGPGFVIKNINARQKIGLDLSHEGFAVADYSDTSFVCCDAQHLPIKDELFESVLCLDTIEHADDPKALVGEVHRILRGGGRAYFSTPVLGVNFLPSAEDYTKLLHKSWGHKRVYSREQFLSLLTGGGFKDIKLHDYMYLPARIILYFYYAATAATGRIDGWFVSAVERLLYWTAKIDSKIKFWSAFNTMAEARK